MALSDNDFPSFTRLVASTFQAMAKAPQVFVTAVDGYALYQAYLRAFPNGTDPVFAKSTEHDCSCCKQFLRRAGNVVTVDAHGVVHTVWDDAAEKASHPYDEVAAQLRGQVLAADICDLYRVREKETGFGAAKTRSLDKASGQVRTWEHLHTGPIPKNLQVASPDEARGDYRTTVQVFVRGLTELMPSAIDSVLALVNGRSLYRGEEHKSALQQFQHAQRTFLSMPEGPQRQAFAWTNAHGPASRFRNTVIGTLVQDLSEGGDLESAVQSFEAKVAPQNYKRTSALITPAMVKDAMATIEALELESALERRFAVISDISVNDVKWVDNAAKPLMKGGLGDALMQHAVAGNPRSPQQDDRRAEIISLEEFMAEVLPDTTSMELLLKSVHLGNLVSLTAPLHPEPKQLFRWDNDFAWSYAGNVADSIAERVKKAGGKVEGAVLRVSLSWFNTDDLDLHVHEPPGRGVASVSDHIYFRNKRGWTGGELDVDMNAGGQLSREAVENVVWMAATSSGAYKVVVNNFAKRESSDVGFVVEVENNAKISHFSYNKAVRDKQDIHVVTLHLKSGVIERIEQGDPTVTTANLSQTKWGLHTEKYVKVNAVVLSPNYWGDNAVGNKHTFFLLDGAKNDEPTRGIYNEFLHPRLERHRKVFELIGDKTKCQPTEGQLSGVGFSSTKRDAVLIKVWQGRKQRLFNVQVGT
ncbi:MAG: hypothetical protein HC863_01620 [Myxococcales bacterium]|nr:hypothetical protein [Myxococcales bacterium]